jgi:glycosyltransferase involved in cell wall biosynthesis
MASNAPVIASNASSIPEVVGSAALLFNPRSTDSIRDAIIQVVSSPTLREDLKRKGILRSKQFTWDRTCLQYVNLYRSVLGLSVTK